MQVVSRRDRWSNQELCPGILIGRPQQFSVQGRPFFVRRVEDKDVDGLGEHIVNIGKMLDHVDFRRRLRRPGRFPSLPNPIYQYVISERVQALVNRSQASLPRPSGRHQKHARDLDGIY